MIADVIEVSGAVAAGGATLVWATSLGAMLAGGGIVWKRMGGGLDKTLIAGVAVVAVGAGLLGYLLGDRGSETSAAASSTNPNLGTGPSETSSDTSAVDAPSSTEATTTTSSSSTTTQPPSTTTALPAGSLYLTDLQPISDGMIPGEWVMGGSFYRHALGAHGDCYGEFGTATYDLEGAYRHFQATIVTDDDDPTWFVVELDESEIARRPVTTGQTVPINVDVTEGEQLRLSVTADNNCFQSGMA